MSDFTDKWTTAAARRVMDLMEEAVKAEREASCARIAEESIRKDSCDYGHGHDAACEAIAAEIRARKDATLPH